ncbi:Alpha/beta hydrolase fold-1 [Aspergillus avenaceus]|uniref:Alpha/beta hydrolase fold-1 n=1 Tax=Aspergillus avenaceus TaxID=36643 RepID=A0A5N6U461_ASPAV|nr:Alpha/beta hydrolase fold-1 [Aspergillus avenaceus]
MTKPTLIFAPGAWYPSTAFTPLTTTHLTPHNYQTTTITFPSIQDAKTITSLAPDIAAVRNAVSPAVEAGQDVIIISHSWSGLPVNSALEGLSRAERQEQGLEGGVVRLIFISAFLPTVGQSLIGAVGGVVPDWYVFDDEHETITADDPYKLFFHDVPDGREWTETLRPHAAATKNSPAVAAAYVDIPAVYLLCEEDRAIPIAVQEAMVEKAREMGANISTERVKTGHTPWLVDGEFVAGFIRRWAGEDV